jgi:flagellar basal body-associated protein FliL
MSVVLILIAIIGFLVFAAGAALGIAALFFMRKEDSSQADESSSNYSTGSFQN